MASNNALNQTSPNFTVNQITINNAPVVGTDGTNKTYVDMIAAGFDFKNTVLVATTGSNLNTTYANGAAGVGATLTNAGAQVVFALDGVTPAVGSRVLVKDQSSTFQNGIYTLTNAGSGASNWVLTRATDYDTPAQIFPGNLVPVQSGTINASTFWMQTDTVTAIGTDPIQFTQFLAPDVPLTFSADSGSATPSSNTITMAGGSNIATSGAGSTVTYNVSGTTNHNVQIGNAGGSLTSVAPSATSGVPLISQGAAADPVFGTAVVAGGGTGAVTFTSHGVLLGNTTSPITATAAGTTGQVLTGVTGSAPTFQSPAASSITIIGDSGGGLTGNSFTFTGGSTGLTFAGAGTTETLGGTLAIANGGTNATSFATTDGTVYFDGTRLVTTATGTSGQILTSNGAGVAPTYQTAGSLTTAFNSVNIQTFTSTGTYTPTAGMQYCIIEVVGGGGGGGGVGASGAATSAAGGGGGGGGYARLHASAATIGVSQAVTIGAAGTAGTNAPGAGGTGGTSSVGALVSATGGVGGAASGASTTIATGGGAGGAGASGDLNTVGNPGGYAVASNIIGSAGAGGASYLGGGAAAVGSYSGNVSGNAGTNYGSGGGGGFSSFSGAAQTGGAGVKGVVVITEFVH